MRVTLNGASVCPADIVFSSRATVKSAPDTSTVSPYVASPAPVAFVIVT